MYVIIRGSRAKPYYLGFDSQGHHQWTTDRLDAIRFDHPEDGRICCGQYLASGAKVVKFDRWDGHYEAYKDYEVQVFKGNVRGIRGEHRWRYRFGPVILHRAYAYAPSNMGYTTPNEALAASKRAVNRIAQNQTILLN